MGCAVQGHSLLDARILVHLVMHIKEIDEFLDMLVFCEVWGITVPA